MNLLLEPLTDYSKFKAMCETVLENIVRLGLRLVRCGRLQCAAMRQD